MSSFVVTYEYPRGREQQLRIVDAYSAEAARVAAAKLVAAPILRVKEER